jgi:transcriptional regulator with PAS, ATPase and Fis domain
MDSDKNMNLFDHAETSVIACDPYMLHLYKQALQLGQNDAGILIMGESGSGKDHLAKYIHSHGKRASSPFIHVNCSAIPDDLFESEMFGYSSGSFTGALHSGKKGLAEVANKGTLFLDEIGELTLSNQIKLLQFLESRQVSPVGSNRTKTLDVRIISATNRNLQDQIHSGAFRSDLYYRLRVIQIDIPPLRKRPDDISAFIEAYAREHAHTPKHFSKEAMQFLCSRNWVGNIRELHNFLERVYVLEESQEITLNLLTNGTYRFSVLKQETAPVKENTAHTLTLKEAMQDFERSYIAAAINKTSTLTEAAELLDINLTTLNRKKAQLGIYKQWKK